MNSKEQDAIHAKSEDEVSPELISADFKTRINIEHGCLALITNIANCKRLTFLNSRQEVISEATLKDSKGEVYALQEDVHNSDIIVFDTLLPSQVANGEVFTYELRLEIPELKSEFTSEVKFTLKDKSVSLHYEFVGLKGLADKINDEEQAHYDGA